MVYLIIHVEISSNRYYCKCKCAKCFRLSVGILTNVLWHVVMNLENYGRWGRFLLLERVLCVNLALRHVPCRCLVKFSLMLSLTLSSADETELVCNSPHFWRGDIWIWVKTDEKRSLGPWLDFLELIINSCYILGKNTCNFERFCF